MQLTGLAKRICELRNSPHPSQVIFSRDAGSSRSEMAAGVLLLKPSSGRVPPHTVKEILKRLVEDHHYALRSVVWWNGPDVQKHRLIELHYPGFHRIAHGGLAALSPEARVRLMEVYGSGGAASIFEREFHVLFDLSLVRTPYDLVGEGLSAGYLNQLWELDRMGDPGSVKRIQRLDEDTFSLATKLQAGRAITPDMRGTPVVLLNGFFARLQQDFEALGCVAIWIEQTPDSTSWEQLRTRYAGKTNPFQAEAGSVRGDAARGVLEVENVSILANVIHLSANELEGRREVEQVWFR